MISITLDHEIFEPLCPWICSSVSWFTVYRNLNKICILLLCESCIYIYIFLSLQKINAGEGVAKREPSYIVDENVNWRSHHGTEYGGSLKN